MTSVSSSTVLYTQTFITYVHSICNAHINVWFSIYIILFARGRYSHCVSCSCIHVAKFWECWFFHQHGTNSTVASLLYIGVWPSSRGLTTAMRRWPAFHHISCHCCSQWWTPPLGLFFPHQSSSTSLRSCVSCAGWAALAEGSRADCI